MQIRSFVRGVALGVVAFGALYFAVPAFAAELTKLKRTNWLATFTTNGYIGAQPFAAAPVACSSTQTRTTWYDTANNIVKVCDGTAYRSVVLAGSTGTAGVIVNADINASAAIARSKLAEDALQVYGIPIVRIVGVAGAALTAAETAGTFDTTIGTNTMLANGEVTDNETEASVAYFQFVLPPEYVAAGDITIRMPSALIATGSPTNNASTLDIAVYEQSDAGAVGADLSGGGAATYAALDTWYNKDFVITATDLVAGDVLNIKITSTVVDSEAGAGTIVLNLAPPKVLIDIKG